MDIGINLSSETPVYSQLIEQIKAAVQLGHLQPGDQLPSIRQLALDLGINPNTVAKAFRLLERDSVIETRGYRGTFVHANAQENCTIDLNRWMYARMGNTVEEFRESGLTDSEIRSTFNHVMKNQSK